MASNAFDTFNLGCFLKGVLHSHLRLDPEVGHNAMTALQQKRKSRHWKPVPIDAVVSLKLLPPVLVHPILPKLKQHVSLKLLTGIHSVDRQEIEFAACSNISRQAVQNPTPRTRYNIFVPQRIQVKQNDNEWVHW